MKKDDAKKVHFTSPSPITASSKTSSVAVYKPFLECRQLVTQSLNDCQSRLKLFLQNDPSVTRRDTAEGLARILEGLKFAL
jgi:hypothetical protein